MTGTFGPQRPSIYSPALYRKSASSWCGAVFRHRMRIAPGVCLIYPTLDLISNPEETLGERALRILMVRKLSGWFWCFLEVKKFGSANGRVKLSWNRIVPQGELVLRSFSKQRFSLKIGLYSGGIPALLAVVIHSVQYLVIKKLTAIQPYFSRSSKHFLIDPLQQPHELDTTIILSLQMRTLWIREVKQFAKVTQLSYSLGWSMLLTTALTS